jgi:hypothetical protein
MMGISEFVQLCGALNITSLFNNLTTYYRKQ